MPDFVLQPRRLCSGTSRTNIHVIAAAYRFLLFLDFHFVKVGNLALDCLYGFGLVDTVDMQIDDNARFQVQNVR